MLAQLKDTEYERSPSEVGNDPNAIGGDQPKASARPPESDRRPSRSISFPRLGDIGVDLARPVDSEQSPSRATGETMTSSPPIVQKERRSLVVLSKKQPEANMHRSLARESDHRWRAEEYRIRVTRHERRALELRMHVAEIETELAHADDGNPG